MEHSETLGALAKALAKAQGEIGDARKDAQNPHFKNRYASLASVRATMQAALAGAELAVVQTTEPHGTDGVCVVTTLVHASGEWMRGRLFVPVGKKDAQGFGSAITYARRYALAAIVGVAADDDDDAEAAVSRERSAPAPAQEERPKAPPAERPKAPPAVDVGAMLAELEGALAAKDPRDALSAVVARQAGDVRRCTNAERAQLRSKYDEVVRAIAAAEEAA